MTWQPSKQTLEDAALAGGRRITGRYENPLTSVIDVYVDDHLWQPHLPTTQGKSDLQDLQLALPMDVEGRLVKDYVEARVAVANNDKHAALAQAVIEVAAQVGAKMRGEV